MAFPRRENVIVGRHRVWCLKAKIGLEAICRRPSASCRRPHYTYLLLLRKTMVRRPNQVWRSDITFVPVRRRVPLSCRDHRLGDAQGSGVAAVKHDEWGPLHRSVQRSSGSQWPAGDHEHGLGIAVHRRGMNHHICKDRRPHLDGRPRTMYGQHTNRTPLAVAKAVRGLAGRSY